MIIMATRLPTLTPSAVASVADGSTSLLILLTCRPKAARGAVAPSWCNLELAAAAESAAFRVSQNITSQFLHAASADFPISALRLDAQRDL